MKGLLLLFCVAAIHLGFAQSQVDSLRNLIDDTDKPENKVDLLNSLTFSLFDSSLEEAGQTADQALRESRKIRYEKGEALALLYQGTYHMLSGSLKDALSFNRQSLELAKKIKDVSIQAYATLQIGKVFRDIGRYDSALHYYQWAETIQKKEPNNLNLARIYSSISKNYLDTNDPLTALDFAKKYMDQALKLNSKEWVAYAWLEMGDSYRNNFQFDEANVCYDKAVEVYGNEGWVSIDLSSSRGIAHMMQGDFEDAFSSFSVVMRAYGAYNGKYVLAKTLIRMGEILEEKGLVDIAHEYLDRALKISEAAGYIFLAGESNYELAWVYYRGNHLSAAENSVAKAQINYRKLGDELRLGGCYNVLGLIKMKGRQFDSSFYYHQKALTIREAVGNQTAISSSLFNIGELYLERQNPKRALEYFNKGIIIDERIRDKYGIGMYKDRIGRIHSLLDNFPQAEVNLKEAIDLAGRSSSLDVLGAAYNDYSILLEKKGQWKEALRYRKLYEANNDSIYTKGSVQSLTSYRTLYDLEAKDQQIELLNKDKQIQSDTIRNRNLILYGVSSIALILGILVYALYYYSKRQKNLNRDLSEKNEEIQTQSEELQEANSALLKLNDEVTRQREEIRNQAEKLGVSNMAIAQINEGLEKMVEQRTHDLRNAYKELDTFFYRSSHDFRRPLTTLMGLCEVAKLSVKDQNAIELFDKVNFTATNLDKMLMKLQSISDVGSHQLVHKEVLLKQIIDSELDSRKETIQKKQIQVSVDTKLKDAFISYPVLVKIIVENLIENAIDFSSPKDPRLSVSAYQQNGSVFIEVKDNGEGIKDEIKPHVFEMFFRGTVRSLGNGLGLYIARKAAEKASGRISFRNNQEGGTTFKVEIPNYKTH